MQIHTRTHIYTHTQTHTDITIHTSIMHTTLTFLNNKVFVFLRTGILLLSIEIVSSYSNSVK